MGLCSTIIRVKTKDDLTAALLLEQAMDDVCGYSCGAEICGGIKWQGKLWVLLAHDGSTATEYYGHFSPVFYEFLFLDDLVFNGMTIGGKITGAEYISADQLLKYL